MLQVGLTGSIAVGKSYVAGVLAELGCHVLDADATARAVVAPGTVGLQKIVEEFGAEILNAAGGLDRAKLGRIVFADEGARTRLNALLHPLIIAAQDEWLRAQAATDPRGVAVVDAALMIESGGYRRFARLIVVHCQAEVQLERLMARAQITRAEAAQRIAAQMPQAEKMRYADFLIDTSAGFDAARRATETVYAKLSALAAGDNS
ncbi:MAG TPA: dephospho-CoA kinase [Pyrinomonadaceae bacterium]|nr:dephospho-CoA kinase [Pyrinomonadaceae bacterium]